MPHVPLRAFAGFLLFYAIAGLAGLDSAAAQQAQLPFGKVAEAWDEALDSTAAEIFEAPLNAKRAAALKDRLDAIETVARQIMAEAEAKILSIQNQLELLGPPPERIKTEAS